MTGSDGRDSHSDTRLDLESAADLAARMLQLASDPDRGGQVHLGSLREAYAILALVEAGQLPGPVTRSAGHGDCTDATGQDWDVKRPRDDVAYPPFNVGFFLEAHIRSEVVRSGENVIVDLTGLVDPANRRALRDAVNVAGFAVHVRWYE
jgi:hypothetical protein